ncbi:MAG TPA: hypothetical protein DCE48_05170 [Lachnospiraceae bacterium]|uniref:hypothetical protein n=1 Tax=Anaerosporobacter sp. TaxID=1872529 RepID=UPI000ECE523C|nr:hypothetical protein [Anaerosporobacter sp.]HAB60089.1 hypothetical protein [Lachnospiraceae bacterium]
MRKKCLTVLLALCLTLSSSTLAFAKNPNVNVSTTPPGSASSGDISTNSTLPPTDFVDLVSYGQMNFSGFADHSTLYLETGFKGVTGVNVEVKNDSTTTLTVTLYRYDSFLSKTNKVGSFTVVPGQYYICPFTNLSSSNRYHLGFSAPSDFSGFVEAR